MEQYKIDYMLLSLFPPLVEVVALYIKPSKHQQEGVFTAKSSISVPFIPNCRQTESHDDDEGDDDNDDGQLSCN